MSLRKPFLTAEWRWLAMLNYEVPPEILKPWLPQGVELDSWQGRTQVSLVGFRFLDTRVMDTRASSFSAPVTELYGAGFREILNAKPGSAFLAEGSEVTVYRGGRLP